MATPVVFSTNGFGTAVTIVASGGLPVSEASTGFGTPVIAVAQGGIAVTLVPEGGVVPDPTRLMFAATRVNMPEGRTLVGAAQVNAFSMMRFVTPDYPIRRLRLAFPAWYVLSNGDVAPEQDLGNAITVLASAKIGSTYTQVTFGGASSAVVADGSVVISDALYDDWVAPATAINLGTVSEVADGSYRPFAYVKQTKFGEAAISSASSLRSYLTGGTASTGGSSSGYGPCLIVAEGWDGRDVVLAVGDSIARGIEDGGNSADANGNIGFIARALDSASGGRIPYGMFAVPGTRASGQASRGAGAFRRRMELLDAVKAINGGRLPFNKVVSEMGVNDSGAANSSTWIGNLQGFWDFLATEFPGVPIYQTTLTPRTTSGGSTFWTTLADQANSGENVYPGGNRYLVNNAIKAKPAPLAGVFDIHAAVSDPAEPGKWALRAFASTLAADAAISATTVSMADAPGMGETLIFEPGNVSNVDAGTTGPGLPYTVLTVTGSGPYSVTLMNPLIKAHLSGTSVKATSCRDQTHPTTGMHITAAQVLIARKNNGRLVPA